MKFPCVWLATSSAVFAQAIVATVVNSVTGLTPLPKVSSRLFDTADHPVTRAELLLDGSRMALTKTCDAQAISRFKPLPVVIFSAPNLPVP